MDSKYYILDGHTPVKASLNQWATWYETAGRDVAKTSKDDVIVSTVFLGIDHSFGGGGQPMLFETMTFGGPHDQSQERCSTWEQAEAMHKAACELAFPKSEEK